MSMTELDLNGVRWHKWAREWLDSLKLKDKTIRTHERHLARLFAYIVEFENLEPEEIDLSRLLSLECRGIYVGRGPVDTRFLNEFLQWHVVGIEDPDASGRKRNAMIYTLRLFFRWVLRHGYLSLDPSRHLETASVRRKVNHHKYLSTAESRAILKAAAASGIHAPRNFALVSTLMLSGVRPGELCNLTPAALDFENRWLMADGKTGLGAAPMPPALAGILRRYLGSGYYRSRSQIRPDSPLFPGHSGQKAMCPATVNHLVKQLCAAAGIDRGVTTYWMRHTFATRLYRLGMGFAKVSIALRHAKLKNTYVYVHGREDRMRKVVEQSPTSVVLSDVYREAMGPV